MRTMINYLVNHPAQVRKFIVALIGALITAVTQGLIPGYTWLPVVIAFASALGVYQVYNAPVLPEGQKK